MRRRTRHFAFALLVLSCVLGCDSCFAQRSFEYGDLKYTIWGESLSVSCVNPNVKDVIVPGSVTYQGHTYHVGELGFNAFEGCEVLETVIIKSESFQVLSGAFKNCYSLREIIMPNCKSVPGIGSSQWPAQLTNIFDNNHFRNVSIKVGNPQAFKASAWKRFTKISNYSGSNDYVGKPAWIGGWFYTYTNEYGHFIVYFGRNTNRCVHVIEGSIHPGSYEYMNGKLYVKLEDDMGVNAYTIYPKEHKIDPGYERGSFLKPADVNKLTMIIDSSDMRSIEAYCE